MKKNETLEYLIYKKIKKDIMLGVLKPKDKIDLNHLSKRYNVSQTPIKTALNRLIADELIINYPRHGMEIKSIEHCELEQIFEIRRMMDIHCINNAILVVNGSTLLIENFKDIMKEHNKLIEALSNNPTRELFYDALELNYQFHLLYLKCNGNSKLIDIFKYISSHFFPIYINDSTNIEVQRKKIINSLKEHEDIVNSILSKDRELVRQSILKHLNYAKLI